MKKIIFLCMLSVTVFFALGSNVMAGKIATITHKMNLTISQKKKIQLKGKHIISRSFHSSNKAIAQVSKKGVVTAKKAGACQIIVKIKYKKSKKTSFKKYCCNVVVKNLSQKISAPPLPTPTEKVTCVPVPMPVYTGGPLPSSPVSTGNLTPTPSLSFPAFV